MFKDIYKRLGIGSTFDQEKERFIRRIAISLAQIEEDFRVEEAHIKAQPLFDLWNEPEVTVVRRQILWEISKCIGERADNLHTLIRRDLSLEENLARAEIILKVLKQHIAGKAKQLEEDINDALHNSLVDLGLIFRGEQFIKGGIKELDRKLIVEPLEWLEDYPESKKQLSEALRHYLVKDYADAITNAYSSLESLVKELLSNDKRFEDNKNEFIKQLGLPKEFAQMIHYYCQYAHEFSSRHGRRTVKVKKKGKPDPTLTESFIYHTGVIMRLALQNRDKFE